MPSNLLGDVLDRPVLESSNAHIALALVLDVSGSMADEGKIDSLNNAINSLIEQIKKDDRIKNIVDLAIFVFGDKGRDPVIQGFRAMSECGTVNLSATDGSTYVAKVLDTAVTRLRERVELYAQGGGAYKPWIVLVTDGAFHDAAAELNKVAIRMKQRETENKLQFFGLGVAGFNRGQLELLTNDPNHVIEVKAANFTEFLSWVGRSFATVSGSPINAKVKLEPLQFTV